MFKITKYFQLDVVILVLKLCQANPLHSEYHAYFASI